MSQTDVNKINEYVLVDTNNQPVSYSKDLSEMVFQANRRAEDDRWSLIKVRTTTVTTTTTSSDWKTL